MPGSHTGFAAGRHTYPRLRNVSFAASVRSEPGAPPSPLRIAPSSSASSSRGRVSKAFATARAAGRRRNASSSS